jgi:hypothetical protein
MLKGDYYVDVTTNTSDVASGTIRKAQILDYVRAIPEVMNGYMIAKQAGQEGIISIQQTMDELARAYNIPKKDITNDIEMKEKAQAMKDQLIALAQQQGIDTNIALQPEQMQE